MNVFIVAVGIFILGVGLSVMVYGVVRQCADKAAEEMETGLILTYLPSKNYPPVKIYAHPNRERLLKMAHVPEDIQEAHLSFTVPVLSIKPFPEADRPEKVKEKEWWQAE